MKIALNWLKKYVKLPDEVTDEELVRRIGARLVEVEGIIDETHKYDNIYVVKVVSTEKIPDTHLTLCKVDVGKELIQVVCGAPNVREGMLAVWIAPGAIVPASVKEDAPFVIGKRKMRGYESCGMLAGADELDFGDDHSGIVEIDPRIAKPGDALADVFGLDDLILEIENKSLTHRPDCFGLIGFAREVAGILGLNFQAGASEAISLGTGTGFLSSDKAGLGTDLKISVQDSEICERYTAVVLEKHGEFRKKYLTWQDTILAKSGMRPVNEIVDATNYLMLLTGQPLHAFDYDKFVAVGGGNTPEIKIRLAREGESLELIDGKNVDLTQNDIVICSGDVPVALAGAMGGATTEIDSDTKKIIIESATFSLYHLRKTQMVHGIFTEAITRFTKGQPSYQTLAVASECAAMLSDGFRADGVVDEYHGQNGDNVVKITTDEINGLLGTEYNKELIVKTLENVGFVVESNQDGLKIMVPAWRTDIHIKEDIIEEVGRLLGYDDIVPVLPLHATANKNPNMELKRRIRGILTKYGANEVLTYSFVSGQLMNKVGQELGNAYKIVNSISPELQYVRQSILPSLLEKAYLNQKIPIDAFAIFEMNKVYRKNDGMNDEKVPVERNALAFLVAERKNKGTAFYLAKKYAMKVFDELQMEVDFMPLRGDFVEAKPFEGKRAAEIVTSDGKHLGVLGEFRNSVRNDFKLGSYIAGFEIDVDLLGEKMSRTKKIEMNAIVKRDLTVNTNLSYGELTAKIRRILSENAANAKILPIGIYQPMGVAEKNISVHLEFTEYNEDAMQKLNELSK